MEIISSTPSLLRDGGQKCPKLTQFTDTELTFCLVVAETISQHRRLTIFHENETLLQHS